MLQGQARALNWQKDRNLSFVLVQGKNETIPEEKQSQNKEIF